MIDDDQFEQLMLQYRQLKYGSEEIRRLIEKEDFDSAITMLQTREPVFLNCKCMRKFLELTPEQEQELNDIIKELQESETQNIEYLRNSMDNVKKELQKAQKTEKIQQTYVYDDSLNGNIVNVEE